jgi:hypothetical protein
MALSNIYDKRRFFDRVNFIFVRKKQTGKLIPDPLKPVMMTRRGGDLRSFFEGLGIRPGHGWIKPKLPSFRL